MATYSVHTKAAPENSLALVREGFSFLALIFGPLWFALARSWLGALLWVAGAGLIATVAHYLQAAPQATAAALAAFAFLMALEASQFRRRSLARRGYELADFVDAAGRREAEIRFLARRLPEHAEPVRWTSSYSPRPASQREEAVGLFWNGA